MAGERNRDEQSMMCCFGTLVKLEYTSSVNDSAFRGRIEYRPGQNDDLVEANTKQRFGSLDVHARKILEALRKDLEIHLYAEDLDIAANEASSARKNNRKNDNERIGPKASLSAVLYGPEDLFENVGQFAAQCKIYLQHPVHCDLDVPYRNPHCLTPVEGSYSTFQMIKMLAVESYSQVSHRNPIDLFADFEDCDALPETSPPDAISSTLHRHQKQALTFMLRREAGWALRSSHKDVWKEEVEQKGDCWYANTITGSRQRREPPGFKGGLLIDAPGLGKSLSMLAVIAKDNEEAASVESAHSASSNTLLVVPKSLIHVWTTEVDKHFHPSRAPHRIEYYGKGRTLRLQNLNMNQDHLVITTYSMVCLDSKREQESDVEPNLFKFKWKRLVLDEAHVIREPSKSLAKSVCRLDAEIRWAITGTPIQNRLTDLFSLFKFLRCHPFDSRESFTAHVTQSWKQNDPTSIGKLKLLVNCLSLRRPKTTIELPPYDNQDRHLEFSIEERLIHDQLKKRTGAELDAMDPAASGVTFFNTLKHINSLRFMCNHGRHKLPATRSAPASWTRLEAQKRFDKLEQTGLAKCSTPACDQDLSSILANEEDQAHEDDPWISESLIIYCCTCRPKYATPTDRPFRVCNHTPRHMKQPDDENESGGTFDTDSLLPTKLQTLIDDLLRTPPGIKSVVFSSWTTTFDILKPRLIAKSIRSVRLDGSLSVRSRINALQVFRDKPDITVLLATISCGGVGLDLTAASRAYIMEPQWNPMSESQALDRVYRLGQQREVTTIRYIMRDSFEENVLVLQGKKKALADLTIDSRKVSKEEVTAARLEQLKALVR